MNAKPADIAKRAVRFSVEKGVPVPAPRSGVCPYPFLDMAPGDSFFVPADKSTVKQLRNSIYNRSRVFGKAEECKFLTRLVEGGVRCWRYE